MKALILLSLGFTAAGCSEPAPPTAPTPDLPPATACQMDAKLCPDGSSVGRSGPDCEFAACPGGGDGDADPPRGQRSAAGLQERMRQWQLPRDCLPSHWLPVRGDQPELPARLQVNTTNLSSRRFQVAMNRSRHQEDHAVRWRRSGAGVDVLLLTAIVDSLRLG